MTSAPSNLAPGMQVPVFRYVALGERCGGRDRVRREFDGEVILVRSMNNTFDSILLKRTRMCQWIVKFPGDGPEVVRWIEEKR